MSELDLIDTSHWQAFDEWLQQRQTQIDTAVAQQDYQTLERIVLIDKKNLQALKQEQDRVQHALGAVGKIKSYLS